MNAIDSAARAAPCGRRLLTMAVVSLTGTLCFPALLAGQSVNPTAETLHEFQKRLQAYVELHNRAEAGVPKLTETRSPGDIDAREKALAQAIRSVRATPRIGEIFGSAAPLIRQIVRKDWAARPPADRRALLAEAPVVASVTPNMTYPVGQPLATVPPTLLQALPRLPEILEYRFMGRRLVLRDVTANLIVDLIDQALPSR